MKQFFCHFVYSIVIAYPHTHSFTHLWQCELLSFHFISLPILDFYCFYSFISMKMFSYFLCCSSKRSFTELIHPTKWLIIKRNNISFDAFRVLPHCHCHCHFVFILCSWQLFIFISFHFWSVQNGIVEDIICSRYVPIYLNIVSPAIRKLILFQLNKAKELIN